MGRAAEADATRLAVLQALKQVLDLSNAEFCNFIVEMGSRGSDALRAAAVEAMCCGTPRHGCYRLCVLARHDMCDILVAELRMCRGVSSRMRDAASKRREHVMYVMEHLSECEGGCRVLVRADVRRVLVADDTELAAAIIVRIGATAEGHRLMAREEVIDKLRGRSHLPAIEGFLRKL